MPYRFYKKEKKREKKGEKKKGKEKKKKDPTRGMSLRARTPEEPETLGCYPA